MRTPRFARVRRTIPPATATKPASGRTPTKVPNAPATISAVPAERRGRAGAQRSAPGARPPARLAAAPVPSPHAARGRPARARAARGRSSAHARSVAAGARPLCVGGDHAITYPILRAVADRFDDLTVVHVDAHPDLYDDLDGNPLSHASPFARAIKN